MALELMVHSIVESALNGERRGNSRLKSIRQEEQKGVQKLMTGLIIEQSIDSKLKILISRRYILFDHFYYVKNYID